MRGDGCFEVLRSYGGVFYPELGDEGVLSLDQVDAISKMATPETERGLVEAALGLSNAVLDRQARRSNPPLGADERAVHDRRALFL